MTTITVALSLVAFSLGAALGFYLRARKSKSAEVLAADLAQEMFRASQQQRDADNQAMLDRMTAGLKAEFGALSLESLRQSGESFLTLARQTLDAERQAGSADLDAKRVMIGESLTNLMTQFSERIDKMALVVREIERTRGTDYGNLSATLREASDRTAQLAQLTGSLREALSSTRARGAWGERMAKDVLDIAGFIEGINYETQSTLVGGTRPDFTFFLPRELRLNMDVKFPLDNYLRLLDATNEIDRARLRKDFLRDVRLRLKEVSSREYINPAEGTCDVVLMFIPNEAVFGFIHEADPALLDDALKQKVVMCSPYTLFANLAVIRAAVDQFALERTSNELLSLFGAFAKQWPLFVEELERHGKHVSTLVGSYESLSGPRRRQVERPLIKIEELRGQRQLPIAEDVAGVA